MATRATYQFTDRDDVITTIYCHYDGYCVGAAAKFYAMLCNPSKGNLATQFIRANDDAEITEDHQTHGDTEYRYTVDDSGPSPILKVNHVVYVNDARQWKPIWVGSLYDFIAENNQAIEDFSPFRFVELPYSTVFLNRETAKLALDRTMHHLRVWNGKFNGGANWNSCRKEALAILAEFPELSTAETDDLLSEEKTVLQTAH